MISEEEIEPGETLESENMSRTGFFHREHRAEIRKQNDDDDENSDNADDNSDNQ